MNQKIKNRGDWFMVGMVVRYECSRPVRGWRPKHGTTWVNHVLIRALSPDQAYQKAMAKGKTEARSTNDSKLWHGKWRFLGLAELIPIPDDIQDGAELLWSDLGRLDAAKAASYVQTKKTLTRIEKRKADSNKGLVRTGSPRTVRQSAQP